MAITLAPYLVGGGVDTSTITIQITLNTKSERTRSIIQFQFIHLSETTQKLSFASFALIIDLFYREQHLIDKVKRWVLRAALIIRHADYLPQSKSYKISGSHLLSVMPLSATDIQICS